MTGLQIATVVMSVAAVIISGLSIWVSIQSSRRND